MSLSLNQVVSIRNLLATSANQKRAGNIVLALILAAAVIATGAAIVLRSQGSYLGSFFSSESKESREAALYGQQAIISELARTPNRGLLLGRSTTTGGLFAPSSWAASSGNPGQNPCSLSSSTGSPVAPTSISGVTTTSKAAVKNQSDKSYWLRSVEFKNEAITGSRSAIKFSRSNVSSNWNSATTGSYSASAVNLQGATKAYIELEVEGESVQAGKTSISRIKKEYEVVPKCCGRSFGYTFASLAAPTASFGQDLRSCPAFGQGILNLVTGANGNGVFNTTGGAFDLWENSIGTNQDLAVTLNPNDVKSLDADTSLAGSTQKLPPQIALPSGASISNSGCITGQVALPAAGLSPPSQACTGSTTAETIYQEQTGSARPNYSGKGKNRVLISYSGCGPNEYSVNPNTAPQLPSGAILTDRSQQNLANQSPSPDRCYLLSSRTTAPAPYCTQVTTANGSEFYCKIRYVDISGNSNVSVDTTGGNVTLLFTDGDTTGSILGGTAAFGGNGGFEHVVNGSTAALADAFRFRVVNNVLGSDFQLKGAAGALAGFFDLRYSDVFISGGGGNANVNLSGIVWTNNLDIAGNVTLVNPPSGNCTDPNPAAGSTCALLSALYPKLFDGDPTNDDITPANDWTPRSVFSLNLFQ
ncbi:MULTISPECIES: hypothetical protein [unclassified Cyanobium]|uniref:hypothetical protein n=1 Tax=unclassified Cyanobium TaxID=2627006 RepID=UPI0020CD13AE|nr:MULTISPECIES: hypothetical protein [unclassified Cyanobium]MCP9776998.1 hypothetical protein [Cyanobium sp. Tous-M-B4]